MVWLNQQHSSYWLWREQREIEAFRVCMESEGEVVVIRDNVLTAAIH
jgi:hypothetical protein